MTLDQAPRERLAVEAQLEIIRSITRDICAGRVPDPWAVEWLRERLTVWDLEGAEIGDLLTRLCRYATTLIEEGGADA